MRPRYSEVSQVALPAKALAQRFALLLLLGAAAVLLVIGKTHQEAIVRIRAAAMDVVAPALDVITRPVEATAAVVDEVRHFLGTYDENLKLRENVTRLQQWQEIARRLERENAVLRSQLNLVPMPQPTYVSARIVADGGGPFVRTLLVNAGEREGVRRGQPAVTSAGLTGRVVEVGRNSSRLLLLTDLNSRVPVIVEASRYRGVLAGDNSDQPKLIFLPTNAKVNVGDRIVTSGHGGVFPPGLAVGVVSSIGDGNIRIEPLVDFSRIEYVSILRYELPHLIDFESGEGKLGGE